MIAALRSRTVNRSGPLRLGIGDDCAILRPPNGSEIAITTDFSLENVHFRRDWHTPESVGHRCLARGLSDLAAMGARPAAAFLSIATPSKLATSKGSARSWIERFYDGLLALADKHKVPLAGGDTAQSPAFAGFGRGPSGGRSGLVSADITLLGFLPRGQALLRSGARPGDAIYITGALGGAAAELSALSRSPRSFRKLTRAEVGHPHFFPEPRLAVGTRLLAMKAASAAIDVSDGLSTDLTHLCEESGVAAEIDAATIPVHPLARRAEAEGFVSSALELALHGGEDYELLFTAQEGVKMPRRLGGIEIHRIGQIKRRRKAGPLVELVQLDGTRSVLAASGWEHFRR